MWRNTQATEFIMGAASLLIEPHRQGVNRNGLEEKTLFYPGILVRMPHGRLPPRAGGLGLRIGALRSELRHSLGIGRGSCLAPDAPSGSRRGRIVMLKPRLARALRTPIAVVLTEPWYSRTLRYQVVLPVLRSTGQEESPGMLRFAHQPWMAVFGRHTSSVALPIQVVHSIWHRGAIEAETEHVLDEDALALIDRALCRFFSLPEPRETEAR